MLRSSVSCQHEWARTRACASASNTQTLLGSFTCCTRHLLRRVYCVCCRYGSRTTGWVTIMFCSRNVQNIFGSPPRLTLSVAVVAQNMTNAHLRMKFPMKRRPLPASETAPSPILKWPASSATGHIPRTLMGVGVYCEVGAFFASLFWQGRLFRILPVFAKNSTPGHLPWGRVYSHLFGT